MRGVRISDRVLLVGSTGDGKSTLAESIIAGLQPVRVIAVDVKDEMDPRLPTARTVEELPEVIRAPACRWVPASFDRDAIEEGFQVVWNTPGPWVCDVEEAAEVSSPNWCPEGLRLAVTQGRRHGKMVLACTQRVAECHPVFRSQSEHIFLMVPRPIDLDLKTIAGNVRREAGLLGAELESLEAEHGPYSHLWYVKPGNELRRCAPVPAPVSRPAARRRPADSSGQQPVPATAPETGTQE